MNTEFEHRQPASDVDQQQSKSTSPYASVAYSLETRPLTSIVPVVQKDRPLARQFETFLFPPRVIRFALASGASATSLYIFLFVVSVALYGTFTVTLVNAWSWLDSMNLAGVGMLSMLFGAIAIISISYSVIEEEDPQELLQLFSFRVSSVSAMIAAFLLGGWFFTQFLRLQLLPWTGSTIATAVGLVGLCLTTQTVLSIMKRFYVEE